MAKIIFDDGDEINGFITSLSTQWSPDGNQIDIKMIVIADKPKVKLVYQNKNVRIHEIKLQKELIEEIETKSTIEQLEP